MGPRIRRSFGYRTALPFLVGLTREHDATTPPEPYTEQPKDTRPAKLPDGWAALAVLNGDVA